MTRVVLPFGILAEAARSLRPPSAFVRARVSFDASSLRSARPVNRARGFFTTDANLANPLEPSAGAFLDAIDAERLQGAGIWIDADIGALEEGSVDLDLDRCVSAAESARALLRALEIPTGARAKLRVEKDVGATSAKGVLFLEGGDGWRNLTPPNGVSFGLEAAAASAAAAFDVHPHLTIRSLSAEFPLSDPSALETVDALGKALSGNYGKETSAWCRARTPAASDAELAEALRALAAAAGVFGAGVVARAAERLEGRVS